MHAASLRSDLMLRNIPFRWLRAHQISGKTARRKAVALSRLEFPQTSSLLEYMQSSTCRTHSRTLDPDRTCSNPAAPPLSTPWFGSSLSKKLKPKKDLHRLTTSNIQYATTLVSLVLILVRWNIGKQAHCCILCHVTDGKLARAQQWDVIFCFPGLLCRRRCLAWHSSWFTTIQESGKGSA